MYFDARLWRLTRGLRAGMAGGILLLLLALAAHCPLCLPGPYAGARVRRRALERLGLAAGAALMVLLRSQLDHWRTVQAQRASAAIQLSLRGRLYDRMGPAWFARASARVMLTVVDGVEQLQTFFGQYLPQLAIAAAAPFAIFAVIAFWDVPTALVLLAAALRAGRPHGRAHAGPPRQPGAHPLAERVRRTGRHAGPAHCPARQGERWAERARKLGQHFGCCR